MTFPDGSHGEVDTGRYEHAHAPDPDIDHPAASDCVTRPHTPFRGYDALTADLEAAVTDGLAELARRNAA